MQAAATDDRDIVREAIENALSTCHAGRVFHLVNWPEDPANADTRDLCLYDRFTLIVSPPVPFALKAASEVTKESDGARGPAVLRQSARIILGVWVLMTRYTGVYCYAILTHVHAILRTMCTPG